MTTRIYDLPTRIFHWLFALSFLVAFTAANTMDDDTVGFSYHMIAGLVMCFTLFWRVLWGIIGSQYARFSDFSLNLSGLLSYLNGVLSGSARLWAGHNPASSWAAIIMMSLGVGLGITGYLMVSGIGGESLEELHQLMANAFIVMVVLHIAGVVIHSLRYRDSLGISMLTGMKNNLPHDTVPVAVYAGVGMMVFILTVGAAGYLIKNFDSNTRVLNVLGSPLQLAEVDKESDEEGFHHHELYERDDD